MLSTSTAPFTKRKNATLFNHWVNLTLHDYLPVNYSAAWISSRSLALASPDDAVMLAPSLRQDFPYIRAHYQRVGLQLTDNILFAHSLPEAKKLADVMEYNPWIYDQTAFDVTGDRARLTATTKFNDKNFFIDWCHRHQFPTPQTDTYRNGEEPRQTSAGPWYFKAAVSCAGQNIFQADDWGDVIKIAKRIGRDFQVQAAVTQARSFHNIQYFADAHGQVVHLATTEQRLEGAAHVGNRFPVERDLHEYVDSAATEAAKEGLRGVFAFDAAIVGDRPYLLECNPRYNGATYPTAIAARLHAQHAWTLAYLASPHIPNLETIDLQDLEFQPSSGTGLVITSWGSHREIGVMIIGPTHTHIPVLQKFHDLISGASRVQTVVRHIGK